MSYENMYLATTLLKLRYKKLRGTYIVVFASFVVPFDGECKFTFLL